MLLITYYHSLGESGAYYMKLFLVFLLMSTGRNLIVRSTMQEKLVLMSE